MSVKPKQRNIQQNFISINESKITTETKAIL